MAKKHLLEEGQIYAVPLLDGSYTITQLCNHHPLEETKSMGRKQSVDTYAFFNWKFLSKDELVINLNDLDISNPFSVITSSGKPEQYGWELVKVTALQLDKEKYLKNLDEGGYINGTSTNPAVLLKAYFGLFPWDGYYKDDYLVEFLTPGAKMRDDIKYLKDFTTEELKRLLPVNSPKLIQRLKEENI